MIKPKTLEQTRDWLHRRFKLRSLREGQAEVIHELLAGRRAYLVAPTGHGKSLCYQALAASPWTSGVVLVFQPLKALMAEQVTRAQGFKLRAAFINSDLDPDEQTAILDRAVEQELDILFLAPERQQNALWQERVAKMNLKGVIIDEAHCISQWGHDFRPWYRRLVGVTIGLGLRTPVLALTATAPGDVVADVHEQIAPLGEHVLGVRLGSHRPNIALGAFEAQGWSGRLACLLEIVARHDGEPGLVYVLTTEEAEMAASFLEQEGVAAVVYHGKMNLEDKRESLRSWRDNNALIICATSALSMGIDRADVRWVAHLGMPDSLIRYVQEIGRVGRDAQPAHAYAIDDPEVDYGWMLKSGWPDPKDYRATADAVTGKSKSRTQIIEETDVPEGDTQRILEDLCQSGLITRGHDGQRATYLRAGPSNADPVPEGIVEARQVREGFHSRARQYLEGKECRARQLAAAMGDDQLPPQCGDCDRCVDWDWKLDASQLAAAQRFLANYQPDIKLSRGNLGKALSIYATGMIGEAVRDSKYQGKRAPSLVIDAALRMLRDPTGPYTNADIDVVVSLPSTSSGSFVSDFAARVAESLGVPHVELHKTRETRHQKSFRSTLHKQRNVKGAFAAPSGVSFSSALLVDDIWNSGVSMTEAARALRPAVVYPLTMARTRHRGDS